QIATRISMAHDFADRLRAAGRDAVGFLYYSGHGVAVGGENFLISVTIKSTNAHDLDVGGIKLTEIMAILNESAPQAVHFIVFDACRNNLGGIQLERSRKTTRANRLMMSDDASRFCSNKEKSNANATSAGARSGAQIMRRAGR